MKKNDIHFNTIIIGNNAKAIAACNEIKANDYVGYNLVGFIAANNSINGIAKELPCLGLIEETESIIREKNIHQVVMALENIHEPVTERLISTLSDYDVEIKLVPDTLEILSGSVKINNVPGTILIDINTALMPAWQNNIKGLLDVTISIISLVILSPLFAYVALRTNTHRQAVLYFHRKELVTKAKGFVFINFVRCIRMQKQWACFII